MGWANRAALLLAFFVMTGCAPSRPASIAHWLPDRYYAAHVDKVLVLVQDKSGRHAGDQGLFDRIERQFADHLIDKGYGVVSRDKLDVIAREIKFERSGMTSDENAAKLGGMANASAVLVVTINDSQSETHQESGTVTDSEVVGYDRHGHPKYGTVARNGSWQESSAEGSVSAKMIPIQTVEEIWTASVTARSQGTTDTKAVIEQSALRVASALPDHDDPRAARANLNNDSSTSVSNKAQGSESNGRPSR